MTEAAKVTRPYEIEVSIPTEGATVSDWTKGGVRTFLVDAPSAAAAERHVHRKYISKARLANGKRVAELMSAPYNCKLETANDGGAT